MSDAFEPTCAEGAQGSQAQLVTGTKRALVLFARAPDVGSVKTRLAAELGPEEALSIYCRLAERVVAAVHGAGSYSVTVAYTPSRAEPAMRRWLGASVALRPQIDGDLGERMASAIADAASAGSERVVVIGTDCPDVTAGIVKRRSRDSMPPTSFWARRATVGTT
jgi:uncharacterized protein